MHSANAFSNAFLQSVTESPTAPNASIERVLTGTGGALMFLRMASLFEIRDDAAFLLLQEVTAIEIKKAESERIMIVFFMTEELPDKMNEDVPVDKEIYQH